MFIKVDVFKGMAPKLAPRKLPPGAAQVVRNAEIWSGEIRPINSPRDVVVPAKPGPILSIYPLGGEWLHWASDVDAVLGPVELDETERTYYTGDKNPKSTNIELATTGGTTYPVAFYRLGLPKPDDAPTVTPSGGTGSDDTRSYVYTFVTAWGEESRPSDPTENTGKIDGTWAIAGMQTTPSNVISISNISFSAGVATITLADNHLAETGEYWAFAGIGGATELNGQTLPVTRIDATNFSVEIASLSAFTSGGTATREAPIQTNDLKKWIYRTDSNGVFRFVAEIDGATTSYNDTDETPGVLALASAEYYAPPGEMQGLTILSNGILAGFFGNQLCLSEPGQPHAWPISYRQTTKYRIVGIKSWGNRIVVATEGTPELWTGYHPAQASMTEMRYEQSCISKRGMVAFRSGVAYPSPDGLVFIGEAGPQLVTQSLLKKDEWTAYNPSSLVGAVYDDRYYGFFSGAGDNGNKAGGIVFDISEPQAAFGEISNQVTAAHTFREDDGLYIVEEEFSTAVLRQYDAGVGQQQAFWQGRVEIMPRPLNFKAAKVRFFATSTLTETERLAAIADAVATLNSLTLTDNGSWGGSAVNSYAVNSGPYLKILADFPEATVIVFKLYALNVETDVWELKHTEQVANDKPFRLPGGYQADEYYFELSGTEVRIHEAMVTETMREMAGL